jgi:hypothetical protein
MTPKPEPETPRQRLAIIGAGSSGLVTLKYAADCLSDWEIVCFEKSGSIQGCWGNPFPGFVSTSTKYTTQFACFAEFDCHTDSVLSDRSTNKHSAFFCDDDYGQYLESFATRFDLRRFVRFHCDVTKLSCVDATRWELTWQKRENDIAVAGNVSDDHADRQTERFDAVIVCTGLAEVPKQVATDIPNLSPADFRTRGSLASIRDQRIVVMGGGESAVDYANRLSKPELNNKVFLSLRSGIRVSPRIHPIRGVPSDFLRTRWMLAIHEGLRNWIGERFVRTRIRYESVFRNLFPPKSIPETADDEKTLRQDRVKAHWAMMLTRTAKDGLFDMFHNKSDDFLDAVARGEIQIIGPPSDEHHVRYHTFESFCKIKTPIANARDADEQACQSTSTVLNVNPTRLVPAIGYQSRLPSLTDDDICAAEFYLGCLHVRYRNLFLIGFARPIIGNIPSISEMQARFVCNLLAGNLQRPIDIETLHQRERQQLARRYKMLDINNIYPVEMFPYCDHLSRLMNEFPTVSRLGGWRRWWRQQFTPATTLHYLADQPGPCRKFENTPVFLPIIFVVLLVLLWPVDRIYRWICDCD